MSSKEKIKLSKKQISQIRAHAEDTAVQHFMDIEVITEEGKFNTSSEVFAEIERLKHEGGDIPFHPWSEFSYGSNRDFLSDVIYRACDVEACMMKGIEIALDAKAS